MIAKSIKSISWLLEYVENRDSAFLIAFGVKCADVLESDVLCAGIPIMATSDLSLGLFKSELALGHFASTENSPSCINMMVRELYLAQYSRA